MKPNKQFELTIRDIEVIEQALRAKAGRRGLAIAQGDVMVKIPRKSRSSFNMVSFYKVY